MVDNDSYLLELSRYVHLNPIRHKGETPTAGDRTNSRDQSVSVEQPALGILTEKGRTPGSLTKQYSVM